MRPVLAAALTMCLALPGASPAAEKTHDLVIYGGTAAAVTAAVQAKRMGKSVIVVSPDKHLGGLSSGGLGWTDTGNKEVIGGLAREFYHRVWLHYQQPRGWRWQDRRQYGNKGQGTVAIDGDRRTMWIFEPHVAEQVFDELIAQHQIPVVRDEWLDRAAGVTKRGTKIVSIATLSGKTFRGRTFIDATYEGDLMAAAGVGYHVGREANRVYGERYNGVQKDVRHHGHYFAKPVSPYQVPGDPQSGLVPRVSADPPGENGQGDRRIQAYCFRMCLTDVPQNRVAFVKPGGYDPRQYELLARVLATGWREVFQKFDPIPNRKTDTNNHGPLSTDNIGMNYDYPEATAAAMAIDDATAVQDVAYPKLRKRLFDDGQVLQPKTGSLALDFDRRAKFEFSGMIGRRIDANVRNWLIRAPASNPGMLAMFRLRDRRPPPELVPWAGEFVGKYLISAVQALRMTDDADLKRTVRAVIGELIASQAEDGYLGPFPKETRLLANWDLWGHYHCMLALMMWHEHTADAAALQTCIRAADLVCDTYLDTQRRVFDAGSHEMNMSIIHALGKLHRKTGNARYLRMMREIEKDWQRSGDYFRTGLAGVEFFRTPKPRWESLHDLQGLVELYRITGDIRYRTALLNHWQSIRRWDRRNSGAFSSGERADGNPYKPSAIETCCTIAWMAVTIDALRLSGDPAAADELELSTLNLVLGAQHPSGSWWTYNTPMDGVRAASAHTIVFQARPGTPELNCCSVNAPRGLGMLSEWAVMRSNRGLTLNYYGPLRASVQLQGGTPVTIVQGTEYPLGGKVRIRVDLQRPAAFALKLRIPAWSTDTKVQVVGIGAVDATPGTYCEIRRTWRPGDQIDLDLDMRLRYESGDREMLRRASIYRGPLLLAYDVLQNDFDEDEMPVLSPAMLADARVSLPRQSDDRPRIGRFAPWLLVDVPTADGRTLRLCDYGSAGSAGSRYVSWLPAAEIAPPPPVPALPRERARVPPGAMAFSWRRPAAAAAQTRTHKLLISRTPDFEDTVLEVAGVLGSRLTVSEDLAGRLRPNTDYYWKLIATNRWGSTESLAPARRFRIDPSLPAASLEDLSEYGEGPGGILTAADLQGSPKPSYGALTGAKGFKAAAGLEGEQGGAVELDGQTGMLVYKIRAFPAYEYTMAVWVAHHHQADHLGQIFSAWSAGMDDPLRICIDDGKLYARVEAGRNYSTDGVPVEPDRWYHVAAVKRGERLTLYVDGKEVGSMQVPIEVHSTARNFALGGNPNLPSPSEHLAGRLSALTFFVRALAPEEIAGLYQRQK